MEGELEDRKECQQWKHHSMEARVLGREQRTAGGKVRASPQRGRRGEAGADRPVMVRERNLSIKSKSNEVKVLEGTVPSQSAEGLTL